MTWDSICIEAINLIASNKTDKTVKTYKNGLYAFDFSDKPTRETLAEATKRLHEKKLTNKTISNYYSALKYVFKNFPDEFDSKEVAKMLRYMQETKIDSRVATIATPNQLNDVLKKCNKRDALIIALLYYGALRRGEVAMLNTSDVKYDTDDTYIVVPNDPSRNATTKGKTGRKIKVNEILNLYLQDYLQNARDTYKRYADYVESDALVVGRYGRLNEDSISRIAKTACNKAGYIDLTGHSFRRGSATLMHKAGNSMFAIRDSLGHKNASTTQLYIGIDQDDVNECFDSLIEGENLMIEDIKIMITIGGEKGTEFKNLANRYSIKIGEYFRLRILTSLERNTLVYREPLQEYSMADTIRFSVALPADKRKEFQNLCKEYDLSAPSLIRKWIYECIENDSLWPEGK